MKPVVVVTIRGAEAMPGGEGAFIEIETNEGPLELRFTYEDAERLVAALQSARAKIQDARVHAGRPPLPQNAKAADVWETAIDPVNRMR